MTDFVALLTEKGRNLAFPNVKLTNFANFLEKNSQFSTSKIGQKENPDTNEGIWPPIF